MYFLTKKMSDKDITEIQRLIPRRDFVDKWKHLESRAHDLAKKLTSREASTTSGAWKLLSSAAPEDVLFLSVTTKQQAVDAKLKNFFTKWRQVREKLPFPEMAEMRITAQLPEYQKILDEAFLLLLDSKLRSHNEIVNFLKPYEPPPPPPPPAARRGRGKAAAAAPAAPGAPAPVATGKRGRKPKGAPAPVVVPAAAPTPTATAAKQPAAAGQKKPPVSAKAPEAVKKASPAKSPGAVAAKPVPIKAAGKKAAPKKEPAKKPAAKKAAPAKAAKKAAKVPAKAAKKAAPAKKAAKKARGR
jgi:hypothetical protein